MKLTGFAKTRITRWIGLGLAASLLGWLALAQGVTTTTVQGTVYLANGQPGSGTLQLSWPAFTTANNLAIAAGRTTATIGSDGFVSVSLAPNLGASPAGLFYTAIYNMSDGSASTEYWVVPAAAQASIAQVRAQVMPAAQAVQAVSKSYVDQAILAINNVNANALTPTGGTLTGPLYLSADPTQSMQAADKHYIDAGLSQTLPLSGGAATGPLTATQLGAAWQVDQFSGADFGAKLQACLSGLSSTYGGTCDARNFPGSLAMSSSVTISTANATILLPCATISTSNQIIVTAATRNVALRGCSLRGASTASGSQGGTVFLYSGAAAMIQVGDPTYAADTMGFHLDNVVINTTPSTNSTTSALIIYRTQELDLQSLYLLGNSNQTAITLDGTGNYTGGTFYDNAFNGFQTAVNAIGHQVSNPATTDWLNASTFVRLHIDCPTSGGNPIAGTTGINLAQGDGNTFTGGDVEGCATALHLGPNAENNTIIGLRNENSTNQIVADTGSSYNNWITGGTMFTGKLTDNGTRNSFLDSFHRSFNGMTGDWYGSQQDATVTNHYRLGIGTGNERGLYSRYQTDYGYRWTTGFSDATAGEQFYQVLDELNNVYRLSIGQYNNGQASTNNQTVVNAAGSGAVVLNGSNNSGTGGVVFGSGGATETTVATINNAGNAQFNGTLQVGGPSTFTGSATIRNQADAEIDAFLWAGATANQKESYIYKDYTGASQWYLVKDSSNNWALNSALGGLDSFKAYQSNNSGDTYINASNSTGVVRVNYETGAGAQFKVYGGNSTALYASFTAANAIQFPGLAASSGTNCLQVDNSGYITNTGTACGTGSSLNGTVNTGNSGQIAFYNASGTALSGMSTIPVSAGGTGATSASAAITALGAASLSSSASQSFAGPVVAPSVNASINSQIDVMAAPYNAKGDCVTDDQTAINAALRAADVPHIANLNVPPLEVYFPRPPGGCYLTSTLTYYGEPLRGEAPGNSGGSTAGSLLRGKPGQDVIHVPDPSTAALPMFYSNWSMNDLAIQVDASTAASFPHRWPGKWFDDAAMTSGSALLTTTAGFINCDDIGQAIQVNGAGVSGANLVTTIASVTPCWVTQSGTTGPAAFQTTTLATAASTTVTGAHTYLSLLGLPVTTTIANCAIAMDDKDGKTTDWPNPSSPGGNSYNEIHNIQITSTAAFSNYNQCGIFTQGNPWAMYASHALNFTISQVEFGIAEVMPELNSADAVGGANDLQTWDNGQLEQDAYPWIQYNGSGGIMRSVQMTAGSGPQFLQAYNIYGEYAGFWYLQFAGTGELSSGTTTTYGTRLEGTHYVGDGLTFGAPGMTGYIGGSFNECRSCGTNSNANPSMIINGSNNTFLDSTGGIGSHLINNGIGNIVTLGMTSNENTQTSMPVAQQAFVGPTKEKSYANGLTSEFISEGNGANPYPNHDALWIWPTDAQFPNTTLPYPLTADSTSSTGYYLDFPAGRYYTSFQQFTATDTSNPYQYLLVGANFPATSATFYFSAKCPSGTTTLSPKVLAQGSPATTFFPSPATQNCTTSYALYSIRLTGLSAYSGDYLVPENAGSTDFQVGWMAVRPDQADYNGYQPAHNGVNSDITSLTGLTTPLTPAQGGTGAGALTGYRYANGTGADTAATTIPATSLSNGTTGSGAVVLANGPTFVGNTTTFANAAAAEQDVVLKPGATADQIGAFALASYSGVTQWKLRKDASNYFRLTDSVNSLDREVFYQNGQTIISAGAGANAVVLNGTANSGTGGLLVQNGASSPSTVLTVTGSGNTTATGFIAGKSLSGSGTMTLAAGSAAGSSPTIACATSHVCDGVSGTVSLTTGTGPATGTLATLTFPSAHTNYANCMVTVASSTAQLNTVTWSESASVVTLTANSALSASTAYQVRYWCGGI